VQKIFLLFPSLFSPLKSANIVAFWQIPWFFAGFLALPPLKTIQSAQERPAQNRLFPETGARALLFLISNVILYIICIKKTLLQYDIKIAYAKQ